MKIDVFVIIESELSPNRSTSKVMWQSGEIVCIISSLDCMLGGQPNRSWQLCFPL